MSDDNTFRELKQNQELAKRPEPPQLAGEQWGLLFAYTGISGFVALYASTLFTSLLYRFAAAVNGFLVAFGALVLIGLLVFGDREVDGE